MQPSGVHKHVAQYLEWLKANAFGNVMMGIEKIMKAEQVHKLRVQHGSEKEQKIDYN